MDERGYQNEGDRRPSRQSIIKGENVEGEKNLSREKMKLKHIVRGRKSFTVIRDEIQNKNINS